jgi:tetratricopeptide (TPR) repeat protein
VSLGNLDLAEGRIDDAIREADRALVAAPDFIDAAFLKSDIDVLRGNFEDAEKECRAILERGAPRDTIFARARLALIQAAQGRFAESSAGMDQLLEAADRLGVANVRATSLYYSAHLDWWIGRLDQASAKLEMGLKIVRELDLWPNIRSTLWALGRVQLAQGRLDQAAVTARELRAFIDQGIHTRAGRTVDFFDGEIEVQRGNTATGISLIERAVSLQRPQAGLTDTHAFELDVLAKAYEKAGDLGKARATYEKITGLTTARLIGGYLYAIAFFKLGEIAEKQGDAAAAKVNYTKFLELWKNADPGRPEVAAARTRLAALR